ncbi:40273_t:CDS:2, partial [Gigaspora margarita]
MQHALKHTTENEKVPELLSNKNVEQKTIFRTINIDNVADDDKIIMPEVKHKRGCPPNNGCIHSAEEKKVEFFRRKLRTNMAILLIMDIFMIQKKKENRVPLKKAKNNKILHLNNVILDIHIPYDAVLEVHNPIGDRNCGFRSLAIAIFKNEKCWKDIKINIKSQLTKQGDFYSNVFGYKCAQLAANTFSVPIIVFGTASDTSLLFLLFNQKPSYHKKPVILQWHGNNHIILVKLKPNESVQVPLLNLQYKPICNRL